MTITADDGLLLAGILTLPVDAGAHPAVLLLHGFGRFDGDVNAGTASHKFGSPPAAALAAVGIAVLRYNRRGVGATPGAWRASDSSTKHLAKTLVRNLRVARGWSRARRW
jgi:alpha/beta superfamily hydrolase